MDLLQRLASELRALNAQLLIARGQAFTIQTLTSASNADALDEAIRKQPEKDLDHMFSQISETVADSVGQIDSAMNLIFDLSDLVDARVAKADLSGPARKLAFDLYVTTNALSVDQALIDVDDETLDWFIREYGVTGENETIDRIMKEKGLTLFDRAIPGDILARIALRKRLGLSDDYYHPFL
jgi:hypothetical protein